MTDADDDLAARVRRLEAEAGIRHVVRQYSLAIDGGDEDAWVACFTTDAVFEAWFPGAVEPTFRAVGAEELRTFVTRHSRRPEMRHQHHVGDTQIHDLGDNAATGTTMFVLLLDHEGAATVKGFGRYDDTFVDDAGTWRITRRTAWVDSIDPALPSLLRRPRPARPADS
jgi:3-phenylpropionate/cinnamic acid dioxygenase small subunit